MSNHDLDSYACECSDGACRLRVPHAAFMALVTDRGVWALETGLLRRNELDLFVLDKTHLPPDARVRDELTYKGRTFVLAVLTLGTLAGGASHETVD